MKYKIIVAGPVGAGKTTAINALTNDNAFMTDVAVSDEVTSLRKQNTTVAMDFGVIKVNEEDTAYVYGTPGQQRFNFMWEILSEGAHGLVLLLDNTRNYPFRDLKYYVESFSPLIQSQGLVVGVTRSDETDKVPLEAYRQWLKELELEAEVRFIDARKQEDVESLIIDFINQIDTGETKDVPSNVIPLSEDTLENTAPAVPEENNVTNISPPPQTIGTMETPETVSPVAPIQTTTVEEEPSYATKDALQFDESSLKQVASLKGVDGVTLTNSVGELLHSTINDDEINEFIAFLSGITPALEEASNMGTIHRIMLRGPRDENLTVFVEEERSLGISSDKGVSVPALSQKIEDMLQWV
ncbi:MAG: ATP/GTP-binding protein [Cocleimonas sp.]|nr:ATP/GTP-binding protein [Cocleimonas sp.]